MDVQIVQDFGKVSGSGARRCVVQRGDEFFVVSTVTAFDTGKLETLAFRATEDGKVTDWHEVAGGIGKHRDEVIAELAADGPVEGGIDSFRDELMETTGGMSGMVANITAGILGGVAFDEGDET